ncbi:MAG: leucine-rich repeat protein [Oscillospiraceae bacterium]|nr:leucine-rich repeat protein [Oscillospiraceae bacterium]
MYRMNRNSPPPRKLADFTKRSVALLALMFVAIFLVGTLEVPALAASGFAYSANFDKKTGKLTITAPKKGKTISASSKEWKNYQKNAKSLEVKAGVKTIAASSFRDFAKLKTVKLPDSVTAIGGNAFQGCKALTSVNLPQKLKTIGQRAFEKTKLTGKVIIPSGIKEIGVAVFRGCTKITEVVLPKNLKSIMNMAFEGCTDLKKINLPSKLERIGDSAFRNCNSLSGKIKFPKTLQFLGTGAFMNCEKITSVDMRPAQKLISLDNDEIFNGCKALKTAWLPPGTTLIGSSMFEGCQKLSTLYIPEGTFDIWRNAFKDTGIKSLTLPRSLSSNSRSYLGLSSDVKLYTHEKSPNYEADWDTQWREKQVEYTDTYLEEIWDWVWIDDWDYDWQIVGYEEVTDTWYETEYYTVDVWCVYSDAQLGISLEESQISINKGKNKKLKPKLDKAAFTYESLNPDIATVSADGTVTGKAGGVAQILVKASTGQVALCRVDVCVPVTKVTVKLPNTMLKYKSATGVDLSDADVTVEPKDHTGGSVKWSMKKNKTASLGGYNQDSIYLRRKGEFTITATVGGKKASKKIKVEEVSLQLKGGGTAYPSNLRTLTPGQKMSVSVKGTKAPVKFKVSNKKVAVDKNGNVTGKSLGSSQISVSVGGAKTSTLEFSVNLQVINKTQDKIYKLGSVYPNGYYWNKNKKTKKYPKVSDKGCVNHGKSTATCQGQCAGFASMISDTIYGKSAKKTQISKKSDIRVGDVIRYNSRHSVFVIEVGKKGSKISSEWWGSYTAPDDYMVVVECNYYYSCDILWGRVMYMSDFTLNPSQSYRRG